MDRRVQGKLAVTVFILALGGVLGTIVAGVALGLVGLLPAVVVTEPLAYFGLLVGATLGAAFAVKETGLIRMWRRP